MTIRREGPHWLYIDDGTQPVYIKIDHITSVVRTQQGLVDITSLGGSGGVLRIPFADFERAMNFPVTESQPETKPLQEHDPSDTDCRCQGCVQMDD